MTGWLCVRLSRACRKAATSEGKGGLVIAERATFRSEARRAAAGANRGRQSDRPEAVPLLWGTDLEVRAHPPNPQGEGESCSWRKIGNQLFRRGTVP